MKQPDQIPEAVKESLKKWAQSHNKDIPEVRWDSLNGCYFFWSAGMYHGVELNGYIHT